MTAPDVDREAIRARLSAATHGAWTAATAPHDTTETPEEYLTGALTKSGEPLWVVWAATGTTA